MKFILSISRVVLLFLIVFLSKISFSQSACISGRIYDQMQSGFHTTIATLPNGSFSAWGELIPASGTGNQLVPISLTPANGYNYTGVPLFVSLGSNTSNTMQAFLMSSTGLYAWGKEGVVVPNSVTSSTSFQSINMPIGVTPTQIKAMLATEMALTLHTITGEIWVCSTVAELHGAGSTAPTSATNYWTRVTTSATGNPVLTNVVDYRISPRGGIAYTSGGTWYTWGSKCYTGNGVATAVLQNRATPMTAPFVGAPKMIAITSDDVEPSYYALNSTNKKIYALGNNTYGQLGQNNTTDQKGWVIVKNELGTGDLTNVVFISANDQDGRGSEGAAGCITSDDHLYLWGSNSGTGMIGAPSTSATVLLPRHPDGYTFGVDFPIYVEVGGHTTGYLRECADRYCYVGHKINGSMGDNVSTGGFINLFDCANTPQALICNASSYDSGDAPLSFESTAPAAHYYKCPAGIQLGALTPNSNNLSPVNVLANADNMSTNGDGLEEDGIASLATYTGSSSYSFTFTAQNTTTLTGNIYGWVDWNGNGVFEATEFKSTTIAAGVSSQTFTFTWTGLSGVVCGKKYLRLRATNDALIDNVSTTSIDDRSIGIASSGEIEDYFINATISISAGTDQSIACLPLATLSATMSAIGTGSWTASTTNPGTAVINSVSSTNSSISNFSANGVYKFIWNSGACSDSVAITITGGITPTLTTSSSSTVLCTGSTGTLTASGLSTYTWSPGSFTGSSFVINPTASTIYTVVGTTTVGCTATKTVNMAVNANPTLSITSSSSSICFGGSTSLTAAGGTSYNWNTGSSATSIVVSPTAATIYTVTGTNALGCSNTQTISVLVNTLPSISASSSSSAICIGATATLTASGGSTYSWNTGATSAAITASPSSATTYTVTGTNALGCSNTQTISVSVNALPVINANSSSASICGGSTATLTATGGNSYSWNTGATSAVISVSPSTSTTYTVTGTNALGCTNTQTVSISINATPTINATSSPATICSGATATLTGTGASTYTWNPGSSVGGVYNVTPSATTIYTVSGTSVAGCSTTQTLSLNVNTTPTVNALPSSAAICSGNTTTLTGSGASTYAWSPGALVGTAVSVNPNTTTIYTVTGTSSGCTNTKTVSITVNITPTVNAVGSSSAICSGATATLTGTGASTYNWLPGGSTSSAITVNPSTTTIYTLTGTGSTGCVNTKTLSLTINAIPTVSATSSAASVCSGSAATLTGSGASTYTWNPGSLTGTSVVVNPNSTTLYTVLGLSAAGCSDTQTISITANSIPVLTLTATSNTVCLNNATTLSATGANSYTWNPGSLTGASITRTITAATVYTVNCLSLEGCSSLATISISLNNCPTAVNDATNTIANTSVISNASTNDAGKIGGTYSVGAPTIGSGSITMNPATGQYTYTPALGYSGITTVSYTLCNGSPVVCSSAVITITVFPALIANPDIIATTPAVATTGSLTLNDLGYVAGATYTVSVTQPSASTGTLTVNPSTGQYTFTPNALFTGSTTTTYTICNLTVNPIVCSTSTITILVGNLPVAVTDFTTTMQNTTVIGNAGNNDSGSASSLTPLFTSGPVTTGTGTLTMNSSTGQYTYTPATGFTGTTTATYTLCNISSPPCSSTTITFTVFPTLVAVADAITTTPFLATTGTLSANDIGIVSGASYSVSVTQPSPSTGTITLNPATGNYTFTPNSSYTGTTTTTYTICNTSVNPNYCSTTTISITVIPNPAPVNDGVTTIENTTVFGNAATNDGGTTGGTFSTGPVTVGSGTITMNSATGQFTYTPSTGFTGTTSATYTLCNGAPVTCSVAVITVTVFPTLVANTDVIATTPSVSTTGTLTSNDFGVIPGGTYTVSVTQPSPSTGSITINPATGQYTFTPNPSFTGSVVTTYTICNTSVSPIVCSTTSITILVGNLPVAVADGNTTMENTTVTGDASANDSGAAASLIPVYTAGTVSIGTGTLTMDPATGNYTYTPATGFTGTTSATYTLCNLSSPPCSSTTITFTVFPTLQAIHDIVTTTPSVTTTGSLKTNDLGIVPSATYSLSVTPLLASTGTITVDPATGNYTFTPNSTFTGSTSTTYTIENTSVIPAVSSSTTISVFVGNQQIAAAKALTSIQKINATTFQSVYSFNVANLGTFMATNVQLVDNLNTTFPSPITYTVVGVNAATPLTANLGYNGNTNIALLSGSDMLGVAQNAIVTLTVNFSPNTTTLTGISNYGIASTSNDPDPTGSGTHSSSDTTQTGTNPDPDGNGNPNGPGENNPTVIGQQIAAAKSASELTKLDATSFQTVFTFNVTNAGPVVASNIQLVDNLTTTFPSPITYTVVGLSASSPLTANPGYNGNTSIALLSGSDLLSPSQNAIITLTVNFSPNATTVTALSNYGVVSTSNLPDPTGSGTHTSIDTTDAGSNADVDGDGNPNELGENDPTYFGQQIGAAKNAVSTIKLANSDNQTTFVFTIQNLGALPATNVQLKDNLNITFPSPITYTVTSLTSGGLLTTDATYNGSSNANLLASSNTLAVGATETVTLVINFTMNNSSLTSLYNYGVAITLGPGGSSSSDTTQTGTNPDPDGDGKANEFGENTPTEFTPINDVVTNPEFSIPQGFSPNGDGVNDLFVIKGISNYPHNTLTILNRWGSVVYNMHAYDNTWNGKSSQGLRFGGDDLPDGTYFYILDLGNNEKPYKGFIYINKTVK